MSNNFIKILSQFLSLSSKIKRDEYIEYSIATLGFSGLHALYAYGTGNKEDIKICNKYNMVNKGDTQFMIVDDKGRHFNVNNSLWYWKWDSVEDWESMKKDDMLNVKYYGFRSPFLGLFPNIVSSFK